MNVSSSTCEVSYERSLFALGSLTDRFRSLLKCLEVLRLRHLTDFPLPLDFINLDLQGFDLFTQPGFALVGYQRDCRQCCQRLDQLLEVGVKVITSPLSGSLALISCKTPITRPSPLLSGVVKKGSGVIIAFLIEGHSA